MNKDLTLRELQQVELEILKCFHNFCEENKLTYYLAGGTLLGAIRHKGFIPWDDDIDVIMPRPDYDRFKEILSGHRIHDNYIIDLMTRPSTFFRICDERTEIILSDFIVPYKTGVWIDVFALDGLESNKMKRKKHFLKMRILTIILIFCSTKLGVKRGSKISHYLQYLILPLLPVIKLVGYQRWYNIYDNVARKNDFNKCDYIGAFEGIAGEKETLNKKNMEPRILVDFEGEKFYAMSNYDEYLTNLYGDYMTPPPESSRFPKHEFSAFWKDRLE